MRIFECANSGNIRPAVDLKNGSIVKISLPTVTAGERAYTNAVSLKYQYRVGKFK